MIRKWSYINDFTTTTSNLPYPHQLNQVTGPQKLLSRYRFKVFRFTTKFKKYILGKTVFTRRLNLRIKSRSVYSNLYLILKNWVSYLLFSRRMYRYSQMLGITQLKVHVPNLVFFLKTQSVLDLNHTTKYALFSGTTVSILSKISSRSLFVAAARKANLAHETLYKMYFKECIHLTTPLGTQLTKAICTPNFTPVGNLIADNSNLSYAFTLPKLLTTQSTNPSFGGQNYKNPAIFSPPLTLNLFLLPLYRKLLILKVLYVLFIGRLL